MTSQMNSDALIIGTGGHSRSVLQILSILNVRIIGLLDIKSEERGELIYGHEVLGGFSDLGKFSNQKISIFLAIGNIALRTKYYKLAQQLGYKVPNLISPSAVLPKPLMLGDANHICFNTFIGAEVNIGSNNIINSGVIVEHETYIGNNCHLAPGAVICGRVKIGSNVYIGAGSVVKDNVTIADNIIVGAGSIIVSNLDSPYSTYVGNPSRKLPK